MHVGAVQPGECALVIDDLIATGGTLRTAIFYHGNSLLGNCFWRQEQGSNLLFVA